MKKFNKLSLILIQIICFSTCLKHLEKPESLKEINVDFVFDKNDCAVPCAIKFTNKSIGNINSFFWDFGDGETSKEENPSHLFNITGNFTVTLKVSNKYRTDSASKLINITNPALKPKASFVFTNDSCVAPCTISFKNTSQNATSFLSSSIYPFLFD